MTKTLEERVEILEKYLGNQRVKITPEPEQPKFKVGDWVEIVNLNGSTVTTGLAIGATHQIADINNGFYIISGGHKFISDNLKKTTAPEPKKPEINWNVPHKFKNGDECWYNANNFDTRIQVRFDVGNCKHTELSERGLLFRSRAEAIHYKQQQILIQELKIFAGFDDLDWGDEDQEKHFYYYQFDEEQWSSSQCYTTQITGLCPPFKTYHKLMGAMEKFADRLYLLLNYDGRGE